MVSTLLKNLKVKWNDYSQLNGKIKFMFQSPPNSYGSSPCSMAIFSSYVSPYQRVNPIKSHETTIFLWSSYGFPMVFLWFSHPFPSKVALNQSPASLKISFRRTLSWIHGPATEKMRCFMGVFPSNIPKNVWCVHGFHDWLMVFGYIWEVVLSV